MIETKLRFFFFLIRCWHFLNNVDVHEKDVHAARSISAKVFHRRKEIGWKRGDLKNVTTCPRFGLSPRDRKLIYLHTRIYLYAGKIFSSPPFPYIHDQRSFANSFQYFFLKDTSINWYEFIFTKYRIYHAT